MYADGKLACVRMQILTDSARKRNRNYNKTRINIGHKYDLWMKLKEVLRVQTYAEV